MSEELRGCGICSRMENIINGDFAIVYIDSGELYVQAGPDKYESEQIDYCPKCGRPLSEEARAEEANPPLTPEELRGMNGEPVWARISSSGEFRWRIVEVSKNPDGSTPLMSFEDMYTYLKDDDYGKTWLAYRRKPREGANGMD